MIAYTAEQIAFDRGAGLPHCDSCKQLRHNCEDAEKLRTTVNSLTDEIRTLTDKLAKIHDLLDCNDA